MRKATLSAVLALSLIAAPADAATLYVGPGQAYATIQAAIDAAANGDTIVVMQSSPYKGFVLQGKSLTILGIGTGFTAVGASFIGSVGVETKLVVHGVEFTRYAPVADPPFPSTVPTCEAPFTGPPAAGGYCGGLGLLIVGDETAVDLIDCNVIGQYHGVLVYGSTLTAHRCVLAGTSVYNCFYFLHPQTTFGGVGLYGRCANVALTGCYVVGGNGAGGPDYLTGAIGPGGDALTMEGGTIIAHDSSFYGGHCSTPSTLPSLNYYPGGTAGDAADLRGTSGRIASHGQHGFFAGKAGTPGMPIRGTSSVDVYTMSLCVFSCTSSAPVSGAPYQTFPRLSLNGAASVWSSGEFVVDYVPPGAEVSLFLQLDAVVQGLPLASGIFGDLLLAPFALPVLSGYADAQGKFVLPVDFAFVPSVFLEIALFMQAGALDPTTGLVLASNALGFVIR